jgi:hypothetical protein
MHAPPKTPILGGACRRAAPGVVAYGYYEESDNVRRKGLCTLDVVVEITKIGETQIALPKEAAKLLEE